MKSLNSEIELLIEHINQVVMEHESFTWEEKRDLILDQLKDGSSIQRAAWGEFISWFEEEI